MPKPVCVKCSVEMRIERVGVVVQFNALSSSRPDKAYMSRRADTAKCPECGVEVVCRYAEGGWAVHHTAEPEKPDIIVEERIGARSTADRSKR